MMRVRSRFEQILQERVAAFLPAALETVWDKSSLVAAVESLKFKPTCGITIVGEPDDDDRVEVELIAEFSGIVRAEIRMDDAGALVIEPLLANLVEQPVIIALNEDAGPNGITEFARTRLIELRDAVRDTQLVSALRFTVEGTIVRLPPAAERPGLMIGEAPEIGAGHEGDYDPLEIGAEIGGGIQP